MISRVKPFLKWAGGKSQLLPQFEELYPCELKNGIITKYTEPFLGGGAVFFDVVRKYKIKSAILSDINKELILTWKVVQKDANRLTEYLDAIQKEYLKLTPEKRKEYFYQTRKFYNSGKNKIDFTRYSESWIERASQMIFLNKTCFNGLYRVNSKGEFNVPFGDYKNPVICNPENLTNASRALSIAELRTSGFQDSCNSLNENTFVYLDPPYRPISRTSNFTAYSTSQFDDRQQEQLARVFREIDSTGAKVMLSNSDPKNIDPCDNFFEEFYDGYNITRANASRMINSIGNKRGKISELIIRNYASGKTDS